MWIQQHDLHMQLMRPLAERNRRVAVMSMISLPTRKSPRMRTLVIEQDREYIVFPVSFPVSFHVVEFFNSIKFLGGEKTANFL